MFKKKKKRQLCTAHRWRAESTYTNGLHAWGHRESNWVGLAEARDSPVRERQINTIHFYTLPQIFTTSARHSYILLSVCGQSLSLTSRKKKFCIWDWLPHSKPPPQKGGFCQGASFWFPLYALYKLNWGGRGTICALYELYSGAVEKNKRQFHVKSNVI